MDASALTEPRVQEPRGVSATDAPDGRIPLIVGVTGHRNLRPTDWAPLESAVRDVFRELREADPGRPLALLTGLAEGADTLVTRIARDERMRLIAVLPMPYDEYERDFTGAAHREFVALHDDPLVVRRVRIPMVGHSADDLDGETRRAVQYALAGAWIARHCDVLLALWDGLPSDRIGGTAHVVHYRRAGSYDVDASVAECLADATPPFGLDDDLLAPPTVGPVHHIVTPRDGQPEPDQPFARSVLLPYFPPKPDGSEELDFAAKYRASLADVVGRIRELHEDARRLEQRAPDQLRASADQLHPESDGALPRGLEALRRGFAVGDALAGRYQRFVNRALFWLFALVFVDGIAFALFTHQFAAHQSGSIPPVVAYAGLLAIADTLFVVVKLGRWQDKYQDYRAIAEGLRVQYFWRLAGLDHAASDHYVRHQRDELAWIPRVVRSCGAAAEPATDDRLRVVHERWADAQAAYYRRALTRAQTSLRWGHVSSGALSASLIIGFALLWSVSGDWLLVRGLVVFAALLILAHGLLAFREILGEDDAVPTRAASRWNLLARGLGLTAALALTAVLVNVPIWFTTIPEWLPQNAAQWLLLSLGLTALAGGMLHAYSRVHAFAEHARRYGRLASVFRRAADRLAEALGAGNNDRARRMIVELGKEALTDHGDWVILHRERPIELPEGSG